MSAAHGLYALLHVFFMASILAAAQYLLKYAAVSNSNLPFLEQLLKNFIPVSLAMFLYGITFFYYLWVLRWLQIGWVYPIYTAFSMILVFLVGSLFFEEVFKMQHILGLIFIVIGILFLGVK